MLTCSRRHFHHLLSLQQIAFFMPEKSPSIFIFSRELEIIREQERAKKKAKVMQYSSRHSRFGGAFVVSNMKSISEREVITHRPVKDLKEISFDKNKVPKKKPKNRKPLTETEYTRRSTLSIRLFLKDFCIQFIEHCYNPLMSAVKVNF